MSDDEGPADGSTAGDDAFAAEIDRARALLDGEGIEAVHVGVVRDGEIDTTFAQRSDGDSDNGGAPCARTVGRARPAGRERGRRRGLRPSRATRRRVAGQVERIPASTDDLPEE